MHLDRIERPVWLDAEARHEASWVTELEGAGASPASIGSFKRVLTGEEVAMVQEICGPIYEPIWLYAGRDASPPGSSPELFYWASVFEEALRADYLGLLLELGLRLLDLIGGGALAVALIYVCARRCDRW